MYILIQHGQWDLDGDIHITDGVMEAVTGVITGAQVIGVAATGAAAGDTQATTDQDGDIQVTGDLVTTRTTHIIMEEEVLQLITEDVITLQTEVTPQTEAIAQIEVTLQAEASQTEVILLTELTLQIEAVTRQIEITQPTDPTVILITEEDLV